MGVCLCLFVHMHNLCMHGQWAPQVVPLNGCVSDCVDFHFGTRVHVFVCVRAMHNLYMQRQWTPQVMPRHGCVRDYIDCHVYARVCMCAYVYMRRSSRPVQWRPQGLLLCRYITCVYVCIYTCMT
jgi:hypothetical protein